MPTSTLEKDSPEAEQIDDTSGRDELQTPSSSSSPSRLRGMRRAGNTASDTGNASEDRDPSGTKKPGIRSRIRELDPRNKLKNLDPRQKVNNMKQQLKTATKDAGKKIAKQAAKRVATAAAENPYVLAAVGVILFILFLIIFIFGGESAADPNNQIANQLTITKTGPDQAAVGDTLDYQIAVAFPNTAQDIIVTDHIPDGTDFDPATPPPAHFDPSTRTVTWNLKDTVSPPGATLSNVNTALLLKLKATQDKTTLVNVAQATVVGGGIGPPGGGGPIADDYVPYAPPSNNCSGKYDFSKYPEKNPLGNYGDPQCNFSKENLRKLLESKESNPDFVRIWYDVIIPNESGYTPQAWAPPEGQQAELDAGGAWGLYQMGSSSPPGQPPPSPGQNGIYDRGDVNWEVQTSNAYNDWKLRNHCNFYPYWGSYQRSGEPNVNHC